MQVLGDAEDAEDRTAAQRATTEQSQDQCDFDEDIAIEGEPPMVSLCHDISDRNVSYLNVYCIVYQCIV